MPRSKASRDRRCCWRKLKKGRKAAHKEAERLGGTAQAYRCRACGWWHVGKKTT